MSGRLMVGVISLAIVLTSLILMERETRRLKLFSDQMWQGELESRKLLELAATEVEALRAENEELKIQLDEASQFISKLRSEVIAQSVERNQSEVR